MTPKTTAGTAISPARLHGEACITCGRADGPLVPAGHIHTPNGRGELGWAVVACPEHAAGVVCPEHAKECRQ